MKTAILASLSLLLCAGASTVNAQSDKSPRAIALIGGKLIDVSKSGHSTHDIPNAVVVLRGGKIEAAGPARVNIPKNSRIIDCKGCYILPGLIDGFAGLNSQAQANAELYMGVTTIVGSQDDRRGFLKLDAHPRPHVYPIDSVGLNDEYSLLRNLPEWSGKLKGDQPVEFSDQDTQTQIAETARRGTRAIWLGHNLTAANTKRIIAECHRRGLITYGEFISTPYGDGLTDGVDVLLHMTRYELGLVPAPLLQPLVKDPEGSSQDQAYAYLRQLDPADPSITAYGNQIKASRAALMPTLSLAYLVLPDHRNLWEEPADRDSRCEGSSPASRYRDRRSEIRLRGRTHPENRARRTFLGHQSHSAGCASAVSGCKRRQRPGHHARHLIAHRTGIAGSPGPHSTGGPGVRYEQLLRTVRMA